MFPLQPLAASMEHGAWLGPGRLGSPDGFEVNSLCCLLPPVAVGIWRLGFQGCISEFLRPLWFTLIRVLGLLGREVTRSLSPECLTLE